jgi:hypothetical protein
MEKLSFEKFAAQKITATQLNKIKGGEETVGGSVVLENYNGLGNHILEWQSDEIGPGGGTTYFNELLYPA